MQRGYKRVEKFVEILFNCGKKGHKQRECQNKVKCTCFTCNYFGQITTKCLDARNNENNDVKPSTSNNTSFSEVAPRNGMKLFINNVVLSALLYAVTDACAIRQDVYNT